VAEPRPVIGITTYLVAAAWGAWTMEAALVPADYVRAVSAAGGAPVLVPPGASLPETLDAVDGLVFSGGSDLDPELYEAEPHPENTSPSTASSVSGRDAPGGTSTGAPPAADTART